MSFSQGFGTGFGVVHGALARNQQLAQQQVEADRVEMENRLNRPYVEEQEAANRAARPAPTAGQGGQGGDQGREQGFLSRLTGLLGLSGSGESSTSSSASGAVQSTVQPAAQSAAQSAAQPATPQGGTAAPHGGATASPVQDMQRGAQEGGQILSMVAELNGVRPDQVTSSHWQRTYDIARNNMSSPMAQRTIEAMHKRQAEALAMGSARAMAAIERNDWEGASRALNALNYFAPDGHNDVFEATGTGLRLTRTPDGGGEPQVINMTADQARASVMSAMNPQWWQEHVLAVRTQAERERANRAGEANAREATAVSRDRLSFERSRWEAGERERTEQQGREQAISAAFVRVRENPEDPEARQALSTALAQADTRTLERIAGIDQAYERIDVARTRAENERALRDAQVELTRQRTESARIRSEIAEANARGDTAQARALQTRLEQNERSLDIAQQRVDAYSRGVDQRGQPRPQQRLTPQQEEAMRGVFEQVFPEATARGQQAVPAPIRGMAMESFGPLVQSNPTLTVDAIAQNMRRMFSLPPAELLEAVSSGRFGMMTLPPEVVARIHLGARNAAGGGGQGGGQGSGRQGGGDAPDTEGFLGAVGRSLSDRWNWQNRMPQPPQGVPAQPSAQPPGRTSYDAARAPQAAPARGEARTPQSTPRATRREPTEAEVMARAQEIAQQRGLDLNSGQLAYPGNMRRRAIINEARASLQSGG